MRAQPNNNKKKKKQEPLISISPHHNFYLDRPNITRKSCLERWLTILGDCEGNGGQLLVIGEISTQLGLSMVGAIDLYEKLQELCSQLQRPETENGCDWEDLPLEITTQILSRVGAINLFLSAQMVCSSWFNICKDPSLWRSLELIRPWIDCSIPGIEKICALAIYRSRGYLESLSIEEVCTDDLLLYIAKSSPNLRRLRLLWCFKLTNRGFGKAAKRLPLLEEVEITGCDKITAYDLGRLCPRLTSFKLKYHRYFCDCGDPDCISQLDGCIIANTMPKLRHLQLLDFLTLTREGLQAILDSCTRLESLDLRNSSSSVMCYKFPEELQEVSELEMRCFQQLKEFQSWKETTDGYWERRTLDAQTHYWFNYEAPSDDHDCFALELYDDFYVS